MRWMLLVVLFVLSGCGGAAEEPAAPPPAGRDQVVQSIADGVVEANDPGRSDESLVSPKQATCFARGLVRRVGLAALEEQGVVDEAGEYLGQPESAPAKTARAWADVFHRCVDLNVHIVRTSALIAGLDEGARTGPAEIEQGVACVRRDVPLLFLKRIYMARLTGAEAPRGAGGTAFNRCLNAAFG